MRFHALSTAATAVTAAATLCATAPLHAATPRETLIHAAFATRDKGQALAMVDQAIAQARALLSQNPQDREARLQEALGIGYRGQLKRSPSDAKAAHTQLEALAQADPRDPETQIAVAGWHLTAVGDLGGFLARTLLGASRDRGYAALNRAVALGGNHAFFAGYAALIRIKLDSDDKAALGLARRAAADAAPTTIDRIFQRAAIRIIPLLQSGKEDEAAALAKQMLPFGSLS